MQESQQLDESLHEVASTYDESVYELLKSKSISDHENLKLLFDCSTYQSLSGIVSDKQNALENMFFLHEKGYSSNDTLFEIAKIYYALNEFDNARRYIEELYRLCPDSLQVQRLYNAICYKAKERKVKDDMMRNDNTVTTAITAIGFTAICLGLSMVFRNKK